MVLRPIETKGPGPRRHSAVLVKTRFDPFSLNMSLVVQFEQVKQMDMVLIQRINFYKNKTRGTRHMLRTPLANLYRPP